MTPATPPVRQSLRPNHATMNSIIDDLFALQQILLRGESAPAARKALIQPLRDRVPPAILAHFHRSLACGRRGVSLVRHEVCSECHIRVARATIHSLARHRTSTLRGCGTFLMLAPEEMPELFPPRPRRREPAGGRRPPGDACRGVIHPRGFASQNLKEARSEFRQGEFPSRLARRSGGSKQMRLLRRRAALAGHDEVAGGEACTAAATTEKRDRIETEFLRLLQRGDDVGGVASKVTRPRVAGLGEAGYLAGEDLLVTEIVGEARDERAVRRQGERGQRTAVLRVAADQLGREMRRLGRTATVATDEKLAAAPEVARIIWPARSIAGRIVVSAWNVRRVSASEASKVMGQRWRAWRLGADGRRGESFPLPRVWRENAEATPPAAHGLLFWFRKL